MSNELSNVEKNEIVQNTGLLQQMDLGSFYSVKAETKEEKVNLFNAINNPSKRVSDFINKEIVIKDVLIEIVELANDKTGELVPCPRIILVDKKGVTYQCVSVGIFSAIKKLVALFGSPTWEDGIKVIIKQITKKERSMLTIEAVI